MLVTFFGHEIMGLSVWWTLLAAGLGAALIWGVLSMLPDVHNGFVEAGSVIGFALSEALLIWKIDLVPAHGAFAWIWTTLVEAIYGLGPAAIVAASPVVATFALRRHRVRRLSGVDFAVPRLRMLTREIARATALAESAEALAKRTKDDAERLASASTAQDFQKNVAEAETLKKELWWYVGDLERALADHLEACVAFGMKRYALQTLRRRRLPSHIEFKGELQRSRDCLVLEFGKLKGSLYLNEQLSNRRTKLEGMESKLGEMYAQRTLADQRRALSELSSRRLGTDLSKAELAADEQLRPVVDALVDEVSKLEAELEVDAILSSNSLGSVDAVRDARAQLASSRGAGVH